MFQKGIATRFKGDQLKKKPVPALSPRLRSAVALARDQLNAHPGNVLTLKERRFCDKYIETTNAQGAAKFAGYGPSSCESASAVILRRPKVQAYLIHRMHILNNPEQIGISDLQREFAVVGMASLSDIASWNEGGKDFTLKASDQMTRDQAKLLAGIEYEKKTAPNGAVTETVKIKTRDTSVYLDKLARTKNAYVENISITHEGTINHLLGRISEVGQKMRMAELDPD